VSEPILSLHGWEPRELHVFRTETVVKAEVYLLRDRELKILTLFDGGHEVLMRIFQGYDVIEIFDRDREDGFHRDFSRYRLKCFVQDDTYETFVDNYEVVDLGEVE
jgi:hypothetical protein